jgi:hypothetical protein
MVEKNPFFGATFAERKAARLASEKGPEVKVDDLPDRTRVEPKQVDKDAEEVEDKAVTSSQSKRTTRKKS